MFCTNCGTRNDDSANNCIQCGAELRRPSFGSADMGSPAPPPPPQAPPTTYQPQIGQVVQTPQQPIIVTQVPNYLVQAILTMLCCCLPFGVVSLVYAIQVNSHLTAGNLAAAMQSSRNAKMWAWIAFLSGFVPWGIWFFSVGMAMMTSLIPVL